MPDSDAYLTPHLWGSALLITGSLSDDAEEGQMDTLRHVLAHSLSGDNTGCPTCSEARERREAWEREHPECECGCCDHR